MDLIVKDNKGKVKYIFGLEAELVIGLLLLGVGVLGVFWIYLDSIFLWLLNDLGMHV